MIRFFSKKNYFIDLLEGFIDIHNHILPGIDDGAKSVEDTLALLRGFEGFGVTEFIATPHIMHNYHDNTPNTINSALDIVQEALRKEQLSQIHIKSAAEHMIDDNFENILEQEEVMPLGNDYLLIEMSYLQPPINFDEAITSIAHHRYFPILAHPERYNFLHGKRKKYSDFKNQGISFQLNALSLGNFYGKEVFRMAAKLLEDGMIDFIGSDVHNLSQLNALKELTLSKKTIEQLLPILENTIATFTSRGR